MYRRLLLGLSVNDHQAESSQSKLRQNRQATPARFSRLGNVRVD